MQAGYLEYFIYLYVFNCAHTYTPVRKQTIFI